MQHYLVDIKDIGDIETAFPHTPANRPASLQDYLEDKLSSGYEYVRTWERAASESTHVFRVVAK